MRIGIILNIPFPHILKTIIVPSAMRAKSQLVEALEIAEGASESPMQIIMGPLNHKRQRQIEKTGHHNAAAGVRKFFSHAHSREDTGV